MTPEVYTIHMELIIKSPAPTKQRIIDYLAHDCVCDHLTFSHTMTRYLRLDTMNNEIAFTNCTVIFCDCKMFKRDNLKYLERLIEEREHGTN